MIIQIRGTSGSGKTTVMRRVIDLISPLSDWEKQFVVGRKQPESYRFGRTYVLGHYEATCGGCDNIGSAPNVYQLIQRIMERGLDHRHILCEGLLLSEDTKWTMELAKEYDVRVVFLTTPVETCIEQVKQRREAAGNTKEFNVENTSNRVYVIERARLKLAANGVACRRCSSDQAATVVMNWLRSDRE